MIGLVGCQNEPVSPPITNAPVVNVGDWSRYEHFQLDSNNQIIQSTRFLKSRKIVQKNMSAFGTTNVFKTIDSTFNPNGTLKSIDSTFFQMSGRKLYIYNFAQVVAGALSPAFGGKPIPGWTAIASTDSTAVNIGMTDSLKVEIGQAGLQVMMMHGMASGGATISNTMQNTYRAIKTNWTINANISGTTVDIPVEFYTGSGSSIQSPLTIIGMQLSGFEVGEQVVQGQRYNLLEFKSSK
ncbi:MAG TPA: hypothetical protein VEC36_13040 [Patescibacteria group bacterium]|nr:hypothetical protein [Patescibacteria group bacterium]